MWNSILKALRPAPKQAEIIANAESVINAQRAILRKTPYSPTMADNVFTAYAQIAAFDPLYAIRTLLEFGTLLKPDAQTLFWEHANTHIPKSFSTQSIDTKASICKYIIDHAHKGKISTFMISNAVEFGTLLTSGKNDILIGTFLSHAAPNTTEFLEAFRPQIENLYTQSTPDQKLSLTRTLLKTCVPFNGKDKRITPPDYIAQMQTEQINQLLASIIKLNAKGDVGYKHTNSCLQELETLKGDGTNLFICAKSDKTDKGNHRFYLYKLPLPEQDKPQEEPQHLYILAKKKKDHFNPLDKGFFSTILSTKNAPKVAEIFTALGYHHDDQGTVTKLAQHFTPASNTTPAHPGNIYMINHAELQPSFKDVSQLTAGTNGVNSTYVQADATPHRDILPLQHDQPREIQ